MTVYRKVVIVGLDGLEPTIVDSLLAAGELPHLAALRAQGGFSRVGTTTPAQTPVAWSTFATGVNPGRHGIFDFLRRNATTYLPELGLTRYEQKNAFVPPRAVNLRRGRTVWDYLSDAAIPSVILRCPCMYPPEPIKGRMLCGMGVPDVRGGLGTPTFFTTDAAARPRESENVVHLQGTDSRYQAGLPGPHNPRKGKPITCDLAIDLHPERQSVTISSAGRPASLEVRMGQWSDWLHVPFKMGLLQSVRGMVRFRLVRLDPPLELYASPVNFDPQAPPFPISAPDSYAADLERELGTYYTTGMVEDHTGLGNDRIDEAAFLDQCGDAFREREAMLLHELDRLQDGLLFCLFDTPDRIQHMFWRFREPDHPANQGRVHSGYERAIEEHYRRSDETIGKVLAWTDDETLVVVLSDHGFGTFRRGVNLNTWLHAQGLLVLNNGTRPGESGDFFDHVDWTRTRAYALGLGGIYLNRQGREQNGVVSAEESVALQKQIGEALAGLSDSQHNTVAVRRVRARDDVYHGEFGGEAPDLLVDFARGYRASWGTALGETPAEVFEDNTRAWGGDHIVDPELVPGVLFMNRPFHGDGARLLDLAPTILDAFGLPPEPTFEGKGLLK
jgi:predicted AlkP superfamily phosphohydrolase/phosphomutase